MKRALHTSLLTLLAGLVVFAAGAQDYVVALQHWDVSDGLPHRQVNGGIRDKAGFFWFTTAAGLSRFDGRDFTNYNTENSGLPFTNLEYINQDGAGMIWLLANTGINNICLFNPATGKAERLKTSFSAKMSFLGGLMDGGIFFGAGETNEWWVYYPGRGIRPVRFALPQPFTFRFLTPANTVWLSRDNQDFYEADMQGRVISSWRLPQRMSEYFPVPIPYSGGIFTLTPGQQLWHTDLAHQARPVTYVPPALKDVQDHLIHTTLDGIIFRQGRLYHPQSGLIRDFPAEGWDDLEANTRLGLITGPGEIWLGGSFGLYHVSIRKSRFLRLLRDPRPVQDPHNAFRGLTTSGRSLLAASEHQGIVRSQVRSGGMRRLLFSASQAGITRFAVLMRMRDGSLLFTAHGRICRADAQARSFQLFAVTGPIPVWCIREWGKDSLLLGTEGGLAWIAGPERKLTPYDHYNEFGVLREGTVNSITPQPDGTWSICASNGLYFLDKQKGVVARYSAADTGRYFLPATRFFECTRDEDRSYWLATATGLIHWNSRRTRYHSFTTRNGLSNDVVYAAYPDDSGRLWLPSDYGLMCLHKRSGRVRTYLTSDGITANEFNRISHHRDSGGRLYFGGINGVTAFHPADFPTTADDLKTPAPLVITEYLQFDADSARLVNRTAALLRSRHIVLRPDDRYFSIKLALLNYSDPEHTTYSWKLDGADNDWHAQADPVVRLAAPPAGSYTLRLRAADGAGRSGANEIDIHLNVTAPYYRRPGFFAGIALAIIVVASGWIVRRNRRTAREKWRLERTVQRRTEALRDTLAQREVLLKEIHHRVKNNLQTITALQQMQSSRTTDPQVKAALQESQNRVLSIAFIHHNLYMHDDLKRVEMQAFVCELTAHLLTVCPAPDVSIKVDEQVEPVALDIDTAVPLGLILNELFTNACKHGFRNREAGTITIALRRLEEGKYVFQFTDDGPGLPPGIDFGHVATLGLRLISRLSKQLGGEIAYEYDAGSRFTLIFFDFETRSKA